MSSTLRLKDVNKFSPKFSLEQSKDWFCDVVGKIGRSIKNDKSNKEFSYSINRCLLVPEDDLVLEINRCCQHLFDNRVTDMDKPWEFRLYSKIKLQHYDTDKPKEWIEVNGIQKLRHPLANSLDENGKQIYRYPTCWFGTPSGIVTKDEMKSDVLSVF